jgi:hypothetical protein
LLFTEPSFLFLPVLLALYFLKRRPVAGIRSCADADAVSQLQTPVALA